MTRLKQLDVLTRLMKRADGDVDIQDAITEIRKLRRDPAVVTLYRVAKAADAECAAAHECYTVNRNAIAQEKWLRERDLFVANNRVFALVDTAKRVYFMDCITGSLYNFGECLTSVIGATGFIRDRVKALALIQQYHARITATGRTKHSPETSDE